MSVLRQLATPLVIATIVGMFGVGYYKRDMFVYEGLQEKHEAAAANTAVFRQQMAQIQAEQQKKR
eukprot:m.98155 g.98155  ORF g.98155 m.98155 type:complete len:65 (+) comp15262_c0_seq1:1972-2166(+)